MQTRTCLPKPMSFNGAAAARPRKGSPGSQQPFLPPFFFACGAGAAAALDLVFVFDFGATIVAVADDDSARAPDVFRVDAFGVAFGVGAVFRAAMISPGKALAAARRLNTRDYTRTMNAGEARFTRGIRERDPCRNQPRARTLRLIMSCLSDAVSTADQV